MSYKVGDRVRWTGGGERTVGGAWDLLTVGALGTVEDFATDEPNEDRLFVVFDDAPMPFALEAMLLGQPVGWPILASELEPVEVAA